jgi:hypothetical protein
MLYDLGAGYKPTKREIWGEQMLLNILLVISLIGCVVIIHNEHAYDGFHDSATINREHARSSPNYNNYYSSKINMINIIDEHFGESPKFIMNNLIAYKQNSKLYITLPKLETVLETSYVPLFRYDATNRQILGITSDHNQLETDSSRVISNKYSETLNNIIYNNKLDLKKPISNVLSECLKQLDIKHIIPLQTAMKTGVNDSIMDIYGILHLKPVSKNTLSENTLSKNGIDCYYRYPLNRY